jgi:carbon-monoxide dehydrogenase medium subunit
MLISLDYHRPGSLEEAFRLMQELPAVQVLAGGTDLLVDIETGIRQAENIVSLGDIGELKQIAKLENQISIGGGCTASEVEDSGIIRDHFPELAEMVVVFASPQIRNRATIAGNICSAVACADFPPILISLGAEIELSSGTEKRIFPLKDFFTGNRQTGRRNDEILTRILVPMKPSGSAASYQKFRRRATNSLALASAAAYIEMSRGICKRARIVLGSVAPIPLPAERAGRSLEGKPIDNTTIAAASKIASEEARPITDLRASEDYRRELVRVLTDRALRHALRKITGEN